MTPSWSRRATLGLVGAVVVPFAGWSVFTLAPSDDSPEGFKPLTEHYGNHAVVYNHDQLQLSGPDAPAALGDTVVFTLTNTGNTDISLGCHNPWTLQTYIDGQWQDVMWTSADAFLTCSTILAADESRSERVTLARSALETETEKVHHELTPGRYRFVLLALTPFVAVEFQIQSR